RLETNEFPDIKVGDALTVEVFKVGQKVNVRGLTRGKGFQGGVKRHNFRTQDATHGNSVSHRALGSTGQNQTPGKVFKGKKMPGQMGNKYSTVRCQKIIRIDVERNLLLIEGGLPGSPDNQLLITPSFKEKEAK
ncbi:MAG TPA: 50S ribosomal protein L3, partial [Coxiellaceae bacterium]|nr:50S ribosomal protein L3 [Coxiellaceae bacterium]